ncbi:chemotaxis protein CheA, partial [bacterium]|nr:chemotaxis protein CheA [bacterium]
DNFNERKDKKIFVKKEPDIETMEFIKSFIEESTDFLDQIEPMIETLVLSQDMEDINKIFRLFHSLKGLAGFLKFEQIKNVTHEAETLLDIFRKKPELRADIHQELVYEVCDFIRNSIFTVSQLYSDEPQEIVANTLVKKLQIAIEHLKGRNTQPIKKPLGEILLDMGEIEEETIQRALKIQKGEIPLGEILVDMGSTTQKTIEKALSLQSGTEKTVAKIKRNDIRVDTTKLDQLFNLVGELITAEAMVTNSPDLRGLELEHFPKAANMMNKIIRELQEVTMSIRMMPLEGLFTKMKRLVKEVAKVTSKKIELSIFGQDTEMDKNVIEEISDPLVHILRNSIDHGVEKPEERIKKSKKEEGNLVLGARYEGNEILISISDDGKGIDKNRILEKALQKEILKKDPKSLTEKEILNLIFEPGLSTAEKLSDLSGRGVGMDVVKKNIEKLHGAINVESEIDKGTTITLRIPLTLAILDVMVIMVGDTQYSIPILSIVETFRPSSEQITKTMDGQELIKVRDQIFPIIRIHEIYNKKTEITSLEDGILIVIESRGKKVGVFVDDIVGQQQIVVKPLSEYIGKIDGLMGAMILGDGTIGLILDIDSLVLLTEDKGIN